MSEIKHLSYKNGLSLQVVDILLEYGYDITDVLLQVLNDHAKVRWCFDRGAVVTGNSPYLRDGVTSFEHGGGLETFKLLHSLGAPLGPRVLHDAVFAAAINIQKCGTETRNARVAEGMVIVRYLVYELHLDVNKVDYMPDPSGF